MADYWASIFYLTLLSNPVKSRLFQKWCGSSVTSVILKREIIDFTGFSGKLQNTAVADEKDFYHVAKTSVKAYLIWF